MITLLDHIAIAVKDLERSIELWSNVLNIKSEAIEEIPDRQVRLAKLKPKSSPAIELVSALGESSPVARFIESKGEGIHHLCFQVTDIEQALKELKEAGMRLIQEQPVLGAGGSRIAFLHPSNLNGVLIELVEIPQS
ncbi:MAG: methylmalonyl-CoA epimerase [Candidatus Aminicenantes bacterium]|nr:methylmalonyl-CoA epimerase [Candidatus Aminicenantes bacterium]